MDIYSIGGGEIIYEVLKAVSMCLNGGAGTLDALLRLGGFSGAFIVYYMILYGHPQEILKTWGIPVLMITNMLFLPTTTVWVKDTITRHAYKIDHVPYGLALFASQTSNLGKSITELVEQSFSTPDDLKYQKTGMMFGSDILEKAKTFKITNRNFKENMRNFVGQCVKYDIMLNQKYSFDDLRNTNDIWALITSNPSKNRGIYWIPLTGQGRAEYVTCEGAVQKFNQYWSTELDNTFSILGRKFFTGRFVGNSGSNSPKLVMNELLANALKAEIKTNIMNVTSYLGEMADNAESTLKQALMITAIGDAASENSTAAGNAIAYSEVRALQQQNNTFDTVGRLATKLLPIMKAVIEALAYACFIFVIPLCMIPQGYKFLLNWIAVLAWLQVWPPMYAILNYIMNIAARASTLSEIGTAGGLTIANYIGVSDANAEMKLLAGYLSMSIPFICIAIVKGLGTFVHLASQLTGTSMQAASAAAGEVSSGNFSFGNVNMRNHSYDNISQLQRNLSSSLSAGGHVLDTGGLQIRNDASGFSVANRASSSGMSDFSSSLQSTEALRKGYISSEQMARNASIKYAEQESIAQSETFSLAHSLSKMSANEISEKFGIGIDEATQIHNDAKILGQYSRGQSYTDQTKAGINASGGVSLGGGVGAGKPGVSEDAGLLKKGLSIIRGGLSAGVGVAGGIDSVNATNAANSEQSVTSDSISEAQKRFTSSMLNLANSSRSDEVTKSAQNLASTISQMQQLSKDKTYYENQAKSFQEGYDRANSFSYTERVNLRDAAMEIAMKEYNVSQNEAIRIMDSNNYADVAQRNRWLTTAKERNSAHMSPTMPAMKQPDFVDFSKHDLERQMRGQFIETKNTATESMHHAKNEMIKQRNDLYTQQDELSDKVAMKQQDTVSAIKQSGQKIHDKSTNIKHTVDKRSEDGATWSALKTARNVFRIGGDK